MNKGPSQKTLLKYFLLLYAIVKKENQTFPFYFDFSKQFELFKAFKIDFDSRNILISKLEKISIIKCTNYHFQRSTAEKKGYGRKYELIFDNYLDVLSAIIPCYFDLDETVRSNPYLSDLDDEINKLSDWELTGLFSDYAILTDEKTGKKGRPAKKPKHFLSDEDCRNIASFVEQKLSEPNKPSPSSGIPITSLFSENLIYYNALESGEKNYPNIAPILLRMRKRKLETFKKKTTIAFPNAQSLSVEELETVKNAYIGKILGLSFFSSLAQIVPTLEKSDFSVSCNIHFSVRPSKSKLSFSYSARQYNGLCSKTKEERKQINERQGYDLNFDLHSAIYAVVRLLEKDVWECDWDLKDVLLSKGFKKIDGSVLTRDEIKTLMYRTFFASSPSECWNKYLSVCTFDDQSIASLSQSEWYRGNYVYDHKTHEKRPPLPKIDEATFKAIYMVSREQCGDISKYSASIFLLESVLECKMIKKMKSQHYDIRNVYDCFYFKSSQLNIEKFKAELNECAREFRAFAMHELRLETHSLW